MVRRQDDQAGDLHVILCLEALFTIVYSDA